MKKLASLFIVAAIGAGIMYAFLTYHFILFDESIKIMKKSELRLNNTFVDARGANAFKLVLQPDLVAAGLAELLNDQKGLSISLP